MDDNIPQAASNCLMQSTPQTADISKRLQDIANKEMGIHHAILRSLALSLQIISNAVSKIDSGQTTNIASRIGKLGPNVAQIDNYLDEQLVFRFAQIYGNVAQFGIGINDGNEQKPEPQAASVSLPDNTGAQPACDYANDLWIFFPTDNCHLMMINPTNPQWATKVSHYGPSTNFGCLESNLNRYLQLYRPGYRRIATGIPKDGELFVYTLDPSYNAITGDCTTPIGDDTIVSSGGDDTVPVSDCDTCTYNIRIVNPAALCKANDDYPVDIDMPHAWKWSGDDDVWKAKMIAFYGETLVQYQAANTIDEFESWAKSQPHNQPDK